MAEYLKFDSPIHNLQVFLRLISKSYNEIPSVIPDGVYGENTKNAVKAFQEKFNLNNSGETDNSTWDKLVEIYQELENINAVPGGLRIYPEAGFSEEKFSYTPTVYLIQSMLASLSHRFINIPMPSVNGIVDDSTIKSIKALKKASGLNPDANITKIFWDYLSVIYDTFVSSDRYYAYM